MSLPNWINSSASSTPLWRFKLVAKEINTAKPQIQEAQLAKTNESFDKLRKEFIEPTLEKFKVKSPEQVKVASAEDLKVAATIRKLKMWEDHVVQHEHAHMVTAGEFASAPSYTYTIGPDGKRYINGGEVKISIPVTNDLESSIKVLEQVKRAAASPSDPSPQDLKTASLASAFQASIATKLSIRKAKEAYEKTHQQNLELKERTGEYTKAIEKFSFNELSHFELFV